MSLFPNVFNKNILSAWAVLILGTCFVVLILMPQQQYSTNCYSVEITITVCIYFSFLNRHRICALIILHLVFSNYFLDG